LVLAVKVIGAFLHAVRLGAEMDTDGATAGETATTPETEAVLVPAEDVTCNVAAYDPGDVYTTVGWANVLVAGVPPGKVHRKEVG
jgi:hypothetical protein